MAALRAELLAEARRDHAQELRKGMQYLEALATRHRAVGDVLTI